MCRLNLLQSKILLLQSTSSLQLNRRIMLLSQLLPHFLPLLGLPPLSQRLNVLIVVNPLQKLRSCELVHLHHLLGPELFELDVGVGVDRVPQVLLVCLRLGRVVEDCVLEGEGKILVLPFGDCALKPLLI